VTTPSYVGVQEAAAPTHYVENRQTGTHSTKPVERQVVAAFNVTSLVPVEYDEIDLTYNGDGTVATAVYKSATVTVATLTLGYTSGNLTSVVRT
jgi:hypothetical protein